jgi:hypothetical protein
MQLSSTWHTISRARRSLAARGAQYRSETRETWPAERLSCKTSCNVRHEALADAPIRSLGRPARRSGVLRQITAWCSVQRLNVRQLLGRGRGAAPARTSCVLSDLLLLISTVPPTPLFFSLGSTSAQRLLNLDLRESSLRPTVPISHRVSARHCQRSISSSN